MDSIQKPFTLLSGSRVITHGPGQGDHLLFSVIVRVFFFFYVGKISGIQQDSLRDAIFTYFERNVITVV